MFRTLYSLVTQNTRCHITCIREQEVQSVTWASRKIRCRLAKPILKQKNTWAKPCIKQAQPIARQRDTFGFFSPNARDVAARGLTSEYNVRT